MIARSLTPRRFNRLTPEFYSVDVVQACSRYIAVAVLNEISYDILHGHVKFFASKDKCCSSIIIFCEKDKMN